jgi:HD-like signal output (HDOD) protein
MLGTDHEQVGALIAKKWNLPATITNAIQYHEEGLINGFFDPDVACVHLADIIARMLEFGYGGDRLVPQPEQRIWDNVSIKPGSFKAMLPTIEREYRESVSIMLPNVRSEKK